MENIDIIVKRILKEEIENMLSPKSQQFDKGYSEVMQITDIYTKLYSLLEKQKDFNREDIELQQIVDDNIALFRKWMIHFKRMLSQKLLNN
jgi:predicted outer membrane protein